MYLYFHIVQTLTEMMEKDSEVKWGNWIGYVFLPLSIALRDTPFRLHSKS